MANTTIIVAECNEKNGWFNFKDNNGKEYSCKKDTNPKIAAVLNNFKPGVEVYGNLSEKDGKNYLWDPKEGGGQKGGGGAKGFDAAIAAAQATATVFGMTGKQMTQEDLDKMAKIFEVFHSAIMSKVSK